MSNNDPDPAKLHEIFTEYYKAGDIEGCVSLYDDDAIFMGLDGSENHGKAGVRKMLTDFMAMGGEFELKTRYAVRTGDHALTSNEWTLRGTGSDGKPFEMGAKTAEIMRLNAQGQWRFLVDHPWGGE
jgi:ketosteroid isomerase-like protein